VEGTWSWQNESLPDELVQLILLEAANYRTPPPTAQAQQKPRYSPEFFGATLADPHRIVTLSACRMVCTHWRYLLPPPEFIRGEIDNDEWSRDKEQGGLGVRAAMVGSLPLSELYKRGLYQYTFGSYWGPRFHRAGSWQPSSSSATTSAPIGIKWPTTSGFTLREGANCTCLNGCERNQNPGRWMCCWKRRPLDSCMS